MKKHYLIGVCGKDYENVYTHTIGEIAGYI